MSVMEEEKTGDIYADDDFHNANDVHLRHDDNVLTEQKIQQHINGTNSQTETITLNVAARLAGEVKASILN